MVPWPSLGSQALLERTLLALSQEEMGLGQGGSGVSEVLPLRLQEGGTLIPHLRALR